MYSRLNFDTKMRRLKTTRNKINVRDYIIKESNK